MVGLPVTPDEEMGALLEWDLAVGQVLFRLLRCSGDWKAHNGPRPEALHIASLSF